jgi:GTPase-activating protein BEM2
VQSADRTGWLLPRDITYTEDSVEIQTIYSTIQDVEPSPLISELGQESLYRMLPPGIRSCMRAHTVLRKWLISKIVSPKLGYRQRQNRMELILRALEIARLRSTESMSTEAVLEQPCVRSFVETVLTSAILSPESRLHARTWQMVALARNTSPDTLTTLLFKPAVKPTSSREALTVDLGWLIERVLDVVSMPDALTPSAEGQSLVNFDKRRYVISFFD